jgi:hypothetical protein
LSHFLVTLLREIRKMNELYGYECRYANCNFMAKSSQSLKQHIGLNHLSTDMFRCDYCHELFVEKDQLMSHSIKHKKQLSVKK